MPGATGGRGRAAAAGSRRRAEAVPRRSRRRPEPSCTDSSDVNRASRTGWASMPRTRTRPVTTSRRTARPSGSSGSGSPARSGAAASASNRADGAETHRCASGAPPSRTSTRPGASRTVISTSASGTESDHHRAGAGGRRATARARGAARSGRRSSPLGRSAPPPRAVPAGPSRLDQHLRRRPSVEQLVPLRPLPPAARGASTSGSGSRRPASDKLEPSSRHTPCTGQTPANRTSIARAQ